MRSKKLKLSDSQVYDNLHRLYKEATEEERKDGIVWYAKVNGSIHSLSVEYGIREELIAGMFAATSPNNRWNMQVKFIPLLLKAYKANIPFASISVPGYKKNVRKAEDILRTSSLMPLKGLKVNSFARNMALDSSVVTVDVWILKASGIWTDLHTSSNLVNAPTPREYKQIERVIFEIAQEEKLEGYQVQAVIWNVIRRKAGEKIGW